MIRGTISELHSVNVMYCKTCIEDWPCDGIEKWMEGLDGIFVGGLDGRIRQGYIQDWMEYWLKES